MYLNYYLSTALYIPEVRFGNVTTMEPILLELVPQDRYSKGNRIRQFFCPSLRKLRNIFFFRSQFATFVRTMAKHQRHIQVLVCSAINLDVNNRFTWHVPKQWFVYHFHCLRHLTKHLRCLTFMLFFCRACCVRKQVCVVVFLFVYAYVMIAWNHTIFC